MRKRIIAEAVATVGVIVSFFAGMMHKFPIFALAMSVTIVMAVICIKEIIKELREINFEIKISKYICILSGLAILLGLSGVIAKKIDLIVFAVVVFFSSGMAAITYFDEKARIAELESDPKVKAEGKRKSVPKVKAEEKRSDPSPEEDFIQSCYRDWM